MLEVTLGDIFKIIFGLTNSPKVDFFDILKWKWSTLDLCSVDLDQSDLIDLEPADVYKCKAIEVFTVCVQTKSTTYLKMI